MSYTVYKDATDLSWQPHSGPHDWPSGANKFAWRTPRIRAPPAYPTPATPYRHMREGTWIRRPGIDSFSKLVLELHFIYWFVNIISSNRKVTQFGKSSDTQGSAWDTWSPCWATHETCWKIFIACWLLFKLKGHRFITALENYCTCLQAIRYSSVWDSVARSTLCTSRSFYFELRYMLDIARDLNENIHSQLFTVGRLIINDPKD